MKRIRLALFATLTLLFVTANFADTPEWIQYACGNYVKSLCINDNYLYIGAANGVTKRDLTTGFEELFNTSNSGLPSNNIKFVKFDNFGNLWVGTGSGLAKYDGNNWTTFTTQNSGLPSNWITGFAFEPNGTIWVTTFSGIGIFDGTTWTTLTQSNSQLTNDEVYSIFIDESGTKWIGVYGSLIRIKGDTWTIFDSSNSPINGLQVYTIAVEDSNTLWVGAGKLVLKYDIETWESFNMTEPVRSIVIDNQGNKWVGIYNTFDSMGTCIGMYNDSTWKFFGRYAYPGIPGNEIMAFAVTENNNVYIGSNGGLALYDNGFINRVNLSSSLVTNRINSIYIDDLGIKWICSNAGLIKYDGSSWTLFNSGNSTLPSNYVNSAYKDTDGKLWISTNGGLVCVENGNWTVFNTSNCNIPSNGILSVTSDELGILWIGSQGGLTKYNGNTWITYTPSNSQLPGWHVRKVVIENNIKWVVTNSGLASFDGSNWTVYYSAQSIADFTDIKIDDFGNKWVTSSIGLLKYDGSTWQIYDQSNSGIPHYYLTAIEIDQQGNKWIGSSNGLAKFDDVNWTVFKTSNSGLTDDSITDLVLEANGNLWISAYSSGFNTGGISVYKEGGVVEVEENNSNSIEEMNYSLSQNYPNPFNPSTTISYQIPNAGNVSLKVYDVLGREVAVLVEEYKNAGTYSTNFNGSGLSSGVYIYRLEAGNYVSSKKLVLMK